MSSIQKWVPRNYHMISRKVNMLYFSKFGETVHNDDGVDIFEADWDNLAILDACREDLFESMNTIAGDDYEVRQSRGSATKEFLEANCTHRDLRHTVYVTANPVYHHNRERLNAEFHRVINVWQEDGWDETVKTVLPETVTERALEAQERYPNKRLLVHYLQPHYPFIDTSVTFDKQQIHDDGEEDLSFWHDIVDGELDVSDRELWDLYEKNLERALPHVQKLVSSVDGKTVVTSDHGNMFGERSFPIPDREWGHPEQIHTPELVEIPWLTIKAEQRRHITVGEPADSSGDDQTAEDRLAALGYKVD